MKLKIERDISIPKRKPGSGRTMSSESELALQMKPGDSVLCPNEVVYRRIIKTLWKHNKAYVSRRVDEGFRVWRVDGRSLPKAANA